MADILVDSDDIQAAIDELTVAWKQAGTMQYDITEPAIAIPHRISKVISALQSLL